MGLHNVNHERRYGTTCANCGKKLGKHRLDGRHNEKSISFCSFGCHDNYMDKQKSAEGK